MTDDTCSTIERMENSPWISENKHTNLLRHNCSTHLPAHYARQPFNRGMKSSLAYQWEMTSYWSLIDWTTTLEQCHTTSPSDP